MRPLSRSATDGLLALIREGSKRMRPVPMHATDSGSLPRRPRAVLFDVYGTLLARVGDAHPRPAVRERKVEALIRRHRLPTTARELSAGLGHAIGAEHAALRASGNANPEVSIERIWAGLFPGRSHEELREAIVEYELATHPAWPMPGCRGLLRRLADQGIALGIVSNAQFYTPIFLHALLGASLEDLGFATRLCLYSWDFGFAKPGAALFDLARGRLYEMGLKEEEVVMVGNDRRNDIEPAARSGFMTVLASLDRRSSEPARDDATPVRPNAVIRQLRSLEPLVTEGERSHKEKGELHVRA
jgi:putative hydrolase of the HAD superfamily